MGTWKAVRTILFHMDFAAAPSMQVEVAARSSRARNAFAMETVRVLALLIGSRHASRKRRAFAPRLSPTTPKLPIAVPKPETLKLPKSLN